MDSIDLEEKFNAILKSNNTLENKIERVLYELKPNGTKEELINYFLYWLNNLIIEDGTYSKVSYNDIEGLLNDIITIMSQEIPKENYIYYYENVSVIIQKIMNIITFRENNTKTSTIEPSSLINIQERKENDYLKDIDMVNRIQDLYNKKMKADIRRIELINQIKALQEEIKQIKEKNKKIDNELADIFREGETVWKEMN